MLQLTSLAPSFPNCVWERTWIRSCASPGIRPPFIIRQCHAPTGEAQLRAQVRSQTQFGNEGCSCELPRLCHPERSESASAAEGSSGRRRHRWFQLPRRTCEARLAAAGRKVLRLRSRTRSAQDDRSLSMTRPLIPGGFSLPFHAMPSTIIPRFFLTAALVLLAAAPTALLRADIDRTHAPAPLPEPKASFPDYKQVILPNGLKIFVVENHREPTITFRLLIKAGRCVRRRAARPRGHHRRAAQPWHRQTHRRAVRRGNGFPRRERRGRQRPGFHRGQRQRIDQGFAQAA